MPENDTSHNQQQQQRRLPPTFNEHRQKSASTLNLTSSVSLESSENQLRSFPPSAAETNSLTNRFFSMFSPFRQNDTRPNTDLTNLSQLTHPRDCFHSYSFASAYLNSSNKSLSVFDQQCDPVDGVSRPGELRQRSQSTFCLNDDLSLTRMSLNHTNHRNVRRSSISSQPLSVDTMIEASRTRKTGAANIWSIGEEEEEIFAGKIFPTHSLSLPSNPDYVSCFN